MGLNLRKQTRKKSYNIVLGSLTKHCPICLNINGRCFIKEKCPQIPLHDNCHCYVVDIPTIEAEAECVIDKFTRYVFVNSLINDKKQLFESWGYNIIDSQELKDEFERQAFIAYSAGDYTLGKTSAYGQNINIRITLKRKNKSEAVTFLSAWLVYPNGKIVLTTPYGGK